MREATEVPMTPDSGPARTEESGKQRTDDVSQLLLTIKEVFVYKVPPLMASSGYRAEEWGLESPVFTGSLRIFWNSAKEKCHICIYRPKTTTEDGSSLGSEFDVESPNLFCDCCVDTGEDKVLHQYVEGVMDSSRYFVLRVEDSSMKRLAYLGIGFRDRDSAFDFKASLDDFMKRASRSRLAENMRKRASLEEYPDGGEELDSDAPSCLNRPRKDFSLCGDVKIHIPTRSGSVGNERRSRRNSSSKDGDEGTGMVLIPPPPSYGLTQQKDNDEEKEMGHSETATNTTADADGWGDFESA